MLLYISNKCPPKNPQKSPYFLNAKIVTIIQAIKKISVNIYSHVSMRKQRIGNKNVPKNPHCINVDYVINHTKTELGYGGIIKNVVNS